MSLVSSHLLLFSSRFRSLRLTFIRRSLYTAVLSHQGLGEYCVADEQYICQLNDKQKSKEEIVVQAFEGARIEGESLSYFFSLFLLNLR